MYREFQHDLALIRFAQIACKALTAAVIDESTFRNPGSHCICKLADAATTLHAALCIAGSGGPFHH